MNNRSNWIIGALIVVVLVLLAQNNGWSFQNPIVPPVQASHPSAVYAAQPAAVSVPANTDEYLGDYLGPEMPFPATAPSSSIAETYDQASGFCATVKVNLGEQLPWDGSGAYWTALPEAGQEAVDDRWPHHVTEYLAKPKTANCAVYDSVAAFYLANPTFR